MDWNSVREHLEELLIGVPEGVDKVEVYARGLVLVVLALWGGYFVTMPVAAEEIMHSWLHYIHLVFHEAGHIIFAIAGDFMATAGGTLMQLLMPAIVFGTFLFKEQNRFGAAVATWWFGHSLMDCGPYAADAQSQSLILLGGVTGRDVPGYHDWNNMLGHLDLLEHAETIGALFHLSGAALIVAAVGWGGYLLFLQYQAADERVF